MTTSAVEAKAPATLGRFMLLRLLGQGGMGMVYEAYDPNLDRRVALKLVRADRGARHGKEHDRLLREAQALARLSHPNVVPIHEVGVMHDQVFLVMEYVSGMTLRQWSAAKERSWQEIVAVYCQAGRGLAAAHRAGLVHRDFKPENVIIGEDERVRVLDFGLARAQGSETPSPSPNTISSPSHDGSAGSERAVIAGLDTAILGQGDTWIEPAQTGAFDEDSALRRQTPMEQPLTETGALVGTPAYMAPEQFDGVAVGPAADQFSFCLALYEALYRQKPFGGSTIMHMQVMMRESAVSPPPQGTKVPRWLFALLCRGLAAKPEERHPTMEVLLSELSRDREGDLSVARRAAILFMSGFSLIGVMAGLWASMKIPVGPDLPVPPGMFLLAVCLIAVFAGGVAIWRHALMVNDVARKLMACMFALMGVITLQRFVGWQSAFTMYEQLLGEYFTVAGGAVVGMLTLSRRLGVLALWMALGTAAVMLWPAHLLLWMTLGFNGMLLIGIWIWLGQRAVATAGH